MKILIINRHKHLSTMLSYYGIDAATSDTIDAKGQDFDISMVFGVWSSRRVLGAMMLLPGVKVFRIMGTDAFRMTPYTRDALKIAIRLGAHILYAGQNLKDLVSLPGDIWVTPIDTNLFKNDPKADRHTDVLYYCAKGKEDIYRLDEFKKYIKQTGQTYTIIDGTQPIEAMPDIYHAHKKYVRFTTHDSNPRMPHEAFLCGCESYDNGVRITEIPPERYMANGIPLLLQKFETMIRKRQQAS